MTRLKKILVAVVVLLSLSTTAHAGIVIAGQEFEECKGTAGGLVCIDANGDLWKCPWGSPCTKT